MTRAFRKFDGHKRGLLRKIEVFAGIFLVTLVIFRFLIGVSWVQGVSMSPAYRDGTAVVYLRRGAQIHRGDVVCIRMAYGEYYIKRVAAVAGDTVDIQNGVLFINGEPQPGETQPESGGVTYPLTVAAGALFLLGDNRAESIDSRTFGTIALSQVEGKVLFSIG